MRTIQLIQMGAASLLAAAMLAACATTNIAVQQAVNADTLDQQTYAWANESFIANPPRGYNRARLNALQNAIAEALDAKGYERVDDAARADLLVNVDVNLDYTQGRGEAYSLDDDEDDDTIGTIRVNEGPQQPTSTATRNQRGRAATMALSAGEDAALVGEVSSLIAIAISDRASSDRLWRGSIDKTINMADIDSFVFEIERDVAELFQDFPTSKAGE